MPYSFDDLDTLTESLKGASVLYNTYWVRFNHKTFHHKDAIANTLTLFKAAKLAGVDRIVHVSITNPSIDSELEYFHGKAELEIALKETGIPHSILRPAVLFGHEDILINNIAWALRYFPVFGIFGDGSYRLQPIHVDDFATLAVEEAKMEGVRVINALGPETYSFKELVSLIAQIIGKKRMLISLPPSIGYLATRVIGLFVNDTFLTKEEISGLMANLLFVPNVEATGKIKLSEWAQENASTLGYCYASELARRKDQTLAYGDVR